MPSSAPPLFEDTVRPSYGGRGISSIPASVVEAFGGRIDGHPPLDADIAPAWLFDGVRTIVLVVVDGLGLHRYRRTVGLHPDLAMAAMARRGVDSALTSVLPSTTTTALATLSTGLTPQEHGLVGYQLYLREVDEITNMIRFGPVHKRDPYPQRRLDPRAFFDHTTLYERLNDLGVTSRVILRQPYVRSPLSRMFYRGAEVVGHAGTHDAFAILRRVLAQRTGSPSFIMLYWDPIDIVSHGTGPDSDEVTAEITGLDDALRRHVLTGLDAPDTLVMITADHGHVHTRAHQRITFGQVPDLLGLLARAPSGDARLPYLHLRPEARAQAQALVAQHLGEAARWYDTAEALADGWFGTGDVHPEVPSRLGSALLDVRGGWKISHRVAETDFESVGCHGGRHREEMQVPLLAARLG